MNTNATETTGLQVVRDRLIPLADAQKVIGVSRSQVYRLLDDGALPKPAKVGRRVYFSEQELQAWVRETLSRRNGEAA
jgi:excisionase family DNA binding protein